MRGRGRWAIAAGLALLAGCDRSEPTATPAASDKVAKLAPPLAAPVAAPASPAPAPPASASPDSEPAVSPETLLAGFPPVDECKKLSDFAAFRDAVFAAAAKRDGEALIALADPAINLDFGGEAGTDELRKRLADPKSVLWDEIAALAPLGCAADGTVATLPAIFSRVPDGVDPARTMLVTGTEVPLRRKPAPSAPTVRSLDWALVTLKGEGFDPAARYAEVSAADGSSGFVATAKLRSVLDYRLIADKADGGKYRITALIAGD